MRTARLGDFCETGSGGTPPRDQHDRYFANGTIPWIKSGELRDNEVYGSAERITEAALRETTAKLVPEGALLVAMYGATVGRLAVLRTTAATNQAVCHIVPDASRADTRYLFHALRRALPKLLQSRVGGAQPNISQAIVRNLEVTLPSVVEQKRIAAILDAAEALREKRRQAIETAQRFLLSRFFELFGPAREWMVSSIGDCLSSGAILEIQDGNHGERHPKVSDFKPAGLPFVTADCLTGNELRTSAAYRLPESWLKRLRVGFARRGDVLLTHKGSVGLSAVVSRDQCDPIILSPQVTYYRLNQERLLPEFLWAYFQTSFFQMRILRDSEQSTRAYIGIQRQEKLPILVPPLQKQQAFALCARRVSAALQVQRESFQYVEQLKQSLAERAFRGEL